MGMENKITQFDYPIVFKYVHGFLTVSIPDLGISEKISIPKDFYQNNNLLNHKESIWNLMAQAIQEATFHIEKKKWKPEASQIKTQLKKPEKDYSLPEFQKKLSEYISVSENTLRREISKGLIICQITNGGHRRIPESEIANYLKRAKVKQDLL